MGSAAPQVSYAFDHVWVRTECIDAMWNHETCLVHVTTRRSESKMSVFDCSLLSADGEVVMHMKGVYARAIESDAVQGIQEGAGDLDAAVGRTLECAWVPSVTVSEVEDGAMPSLGR